MKQVTDKETLARQDAAEAEYEAAVAEAKRVSHEARMAIQPELDALLRAAARAASTEDKEMKAADEAYYAKLRPISKAYDAAVEAAKAKYDLEFDAALEAFVKCGKFE